MEEQLNYDFSEYERLLQTKDYKSLSDREKSIVNHFSSEEDYLGMRRILLSNAETVKNECKTMQPAPEILENLIGTMKSRQTGFSMFDFFKSMFKYKVPAYQLIIYATVFALIFLIVFKREKIITVDKPVYVYKTDTIEKYIIKESKSDIKKPIKTVIPKTLKQITLNNQEKPDSTHIYNDNIYSKNSLDLLGFNTNLKEKIENIKPKGRTMHDDSVLVKFLVKI